MACFWYSRLSKNFRLSIASSVDSKTENRAQVNYRASLGKPIISIVVEWRSLVNLSTSLYMEEDT